MVLFPLLPHHVALQIAESARSASVQSLAASAATEHAACVYTPTGGIRATSTRLADLRRGLLKLAEAAGYPEAPNQQQAADFDAEAAVALAVLMPIAPAEAIKGGLWEFLSCILLPDLVRWRFRGQGGETSIDRFVSGRRNTYQRLWWRSFHLSSGTQPDGRLRELLQSLGEDELVQLMERPSIAGIEGLPAAIAEGLLSASVNYSGIATRRVLIREAQKRFLRLSSFLSLEALSREEASRQVDAVFTQVAASFTNPPDGNTLSQ